MAKVQKDRAGGHGEFIRLFVAHERRILAFLLSLVPNLTEAEELLQETSVVLWEKFDQFRPGTDFIAWACRVAHLKVLQHHERRSRRRLSFQPHLLEKIALDAQAAGEEIEDRHLALAECLKKLSAPQRELLRLRYSDGAGVRTTAAALGRSVHAVYKALPKLHQALFRCIQDRLAAGGAL